MSTETHEKLYTVEQVAEMLTLSPRTVQRHIYGYSKPKLASITIGNSRRIRASAVDAFFLAIEAAKR